MREISLKEMQQIELDILLAFDALCKKHGLRYYMDGGTLLGAMCYEGFIPWDDDIDLKMPRPDYESFLQLAQQTGVLPPHIRLERPSVHSSDYLFAKLVDTRTLLIENPGENEKRGGVYVDVFPMDGYPEGEEERAAHLRKLARLNTLFHYSLEHFSSMKQSKSLLTRLKGRWYDRLYSPGQIYQMLEREACRYDYDSASCVGLLIEGNPEKECFHKEWLEPEVQLEFQGYRFPAPNGYKKHMQIFYGDHITREEYHHNLPVIQPDHRHLVYWLNDEEEHRTAVEPVVVSVAVITYNMQQYLPQLLDSILMQQTNFRYEIVVDDDHSPDDSRRILQEYQERYPDHFVLSLRDTNVGGSRNMYGVLRQCRGKYIAILEGDDWWDCPDKLQYQYDFMESHPEYIAMYCNSWVETSLTEVIHHPRRNIRKPMIFSYRDYMNYHFFDRLPNSTDTAFFHNIFRDGSEKELDVFYKAHNMVWDQSLALILYGRGKVYVDPRLVSHHRSIVASDGTNYQSLYAKRDNKVSDAQMYACQEDYIERVLHRRCTRFYKVRGMLYAEAYWIARKSRKQEDRDKAEAIWNQRKKRWPLVWWTFVWGCGTVKRKLLHGRSRKER